MKVVMTTFFEYFVSEFFFFGEIILRIDLLKGTLVFEYLRVEYFRREKKANRKGFQIENKKENSFSENKIFYDQTLTTMIEI